MKINTFNLTFYFLCSIFQNIEVKRISNVKTSSSTYHHLSTFVNREIDTKQVLDLMFVHDPDYIIPLFIELSCLGSL